MMESLRRTLRRQNWWVDFQTMQREGWGNAYKRLSIQRKILQTGPVYTDLTGPLEVRALTWRRDWVNMLWALKSFYFHSRSTLPLHIHDGGLLPEQVRILKSHFPNATVVGVQEADMRVEAELDRRGLTQIKSYRPKNQCTRKLVDYFVFSTAEAVIHIDSDIVFLSDPHELVQLDKRANLYNKDFQFCYTMSHEELKQTFGFEVMPRINGGLYRVYRDSMDFELMETWLQNRMLFENSWVTEQTLHAMCSTLYGVDWLPDRYVVGSDPGIPPDAACKHYAGFFRPLLYQEGMATLVGRGFLKEFPSYSAWTRTQTAKASLLPGKARRLEEQVKY